MLDVSGLLGHPLVVLILRVIVINRSEVLPVLTSGTADISATVCTDLRQVDIDIADVGGVLIHIRHGDGVGNGGCFGDDHVLASLAFVRRH